MHYRPVGTGRCIIEWKGRGDALQTGRDEEMYYKEVGTGRCIIDR
jgi:hypothetical protein